MTDLKVFSLLIMIEKDREKALKLAQDDEIMLEYLKEVKNLYEELQKKEKSILIMEFEKSIYLY